MTSKKQHIVLIGFMGSGKSTIGRLLSDKINMPFIDMDDYIEKQEGRRIKDIFDLQGENIFREIERTALIELMEIKESTIISTGGGAPCYFDNMNKINENGMSFYLRVGRQVLTNRLRNDNERPLLENKTQKELFRFVDIKLSERERFYNQADFTIRGKDDPVVIVNRLIRIKQKSSE